ncbi:MAG: hypothetical protein QM648_06910 [Solirubrobacterales bacterium]
MNSESKRPSKRRAMVAAGGLTILLIVGLFVLANPFGGGASSGQTSSDPYALNFDGENFTGDDAAKAVKTEPVAQRDSEEKYASACASCAKKHQVAEMPAASTTTQVAKGAPTSKQLEKALKKQHMSAQIAKGSKVELASDGSAVAPLNAPDAVQAVVAAGNAIKNYPYIWGGGHASFQANGYDCSGSVSYALKGANLVSEPMVSGDFSSYGEPGPGKWITIYSSPGHVFMFVGGLRFDTSFRDGPYGTRWQNGKRSLTGFTVTHPVGL